MVIYVYHLHHHFSPCIWCIDLFLNPIAKTDIVGVFLAFRKRLSLLLFAQPLQSFIIYCFHYLPISTNKNFFGPIRFQVAGFAESTRLH